MKTQEFGRKDMEQIDDILRHSNKPCKDEGYCEQVKAGLIMMSGGDEIEKGTDYAAKMLAYLDMKKQAGYSTYSARKMIRENLNRCYLRLFREQELQKTKNQAALAKKNSNKEHSL